MRVVRGVPVLALLFALATAFALVRRAEAQPPKHNFVVIFIDDLGWTDLSAYGSTFYETPNVDSMVRGGMKFTSAYAAAPVCSPTRASLLTGKYPARLRLTDWIPGRRQWPHARVLVPGFNLQLPLEEITIAEALKPAGYVSASIGKWHLGEEGHYPEKQGFSLNVAGTNRGSPPTYFSPYRIPGLPDGPPGEDLTDRLTAEAELFLEANRDKPFFLYLSHFTVHLPLQAKEELVSRYRAKARPDQSHRDPVYAAMIHTMDESVGRILKKLDELRLTERTVVIFTSDNGGLIYEGQRKDAVTSNAPLRAGKGHLYEGGIRVPLIVRWPGTARLGSVSDAPVSSVDLFPTILEIAGVDRAPESDIDGVSLVPLLRQSGEPRRDALYWHYPHYSNQGGEPAGAVRRGDYKLIEFYEDGRLELYNLKKDIGERNDLAAGDPAATSELRRMLTSWRDRMSAAMPSRNPDYDPARSDQGLTGSERLIRRE